ncbi:MAG TPA: polysaccharide biosynthesis/export family protein [Hyphomicrobium sp.]|nr:polysaccharide biosynthesis/export family protein [Hyphomicrobium sp.]
MSSVERVNIRIPGVASLSGEYRITGDGTIALPGIGRLNVGDATIVEFETQLATEIQRVTNRESSVAVEVIDYRPVFVSGVVAHSGAFPWKAGYSILHVEALAGGLFRGPASPEANALEPTTDREHERAMRAGYGLASTLASIERLKTEMRNGSEYILPPRVMQLVSKADQQALNSAQQATLASRQSVFNAKVTALQNAKAMAQKDKAALTDQIERVDRQLKQRRSFVQKIQYMAENRYVRGDRLFEEQVRVAELEERMTTTTIAISRAEVAANAAQADLESIVLSRNAEIDGEILALEQKKVGFEMDIDSANSVYKRMTGQEVNTSRAAEPMIPRYEIVRAEAGKSQVIRADRATAVMPGDVVVVSYGRPDS